MAIEYISELGDKLSKNNTAANLPKHIKVISAPNYQRTDNGVVTNPSLQTALDGKAESTHTHGNITNGGALQTTDVAIANGDKLVVTDASDSNKVARTSVSFDGSTTTKALTQKGTWETFNNYTHPTTSGNKHVPSGGSSGQFLGWSADGTAAWVANPNTDTKVTSSANHYTPATAAGSDVSASASGATAAWSIDVVKGVTLNTDGKGHVTGLSVTSGKIPSNPNTDTKVKATAKTDNVNYKILATASASPTSGNATEAVYDADITLNPSTNTIAANISGNAATATKATQDSDGNAINATYFKSSGNVTLVSNTATKIGTQNGADVKLTLPAIPAAVSVKGNAESSYRTGQVNLTPANLGISATTSSVTVGSTTFNKYTHPTTSGNKHVPSGGSSGQFLGWNSDGTAKWVNSPNTDTKVKATSSSTDAEYKLLATASASPTSDAATEAIYNSAVTINPSTKTIAADYCDSNKGIIARQINGSSTTGLARLGQFVYSSGTSAIRAQAIFRISATNSSKETRCEFLVRFAFQVNVTDGKITGFSNSDIYTYKKIRKASPAIHVYYTLTDAGVINVYVGPASATSGATFRYLWSVQSWDMGVKFVVQNLGNEITTYPGNMTQVTERIETQGTGGDESTPVYVNSSGQVEPCTNIVADSVNVGAMAPNTSYHSYCIPVVDDSGNLYKETNTTTPAPNRLYYEGRYNLLNVNISGTADYLAPAMFSDSGAPTTFSLLVFDSDNRPYRNNANDGMLVYNRTAKTLAVNISGSVNGKNFVFGSYTGNAGDVCFC